MPAPKKSYEEVRIPLSKMSFTPDIPSTSLGPNEYNVGQNIETDLRGIRSVLGDYVTSPRGIPGNVTFITGGFRQPRVGVTSNYYFIVATTQGRWYASNNVDPLPTSLYPVPGFNGAEWQDITPAAGPFTSYTQATNITEAWNGTIPFFNDETNAPMFWPESLTEQYPKLVMYSQSQPTTIYDISFVDATTQEITFNDIFDSTGSSIAGTTLTLGVVSADPIINPGMYISGIGVTVGTQLVKQLTNPIPGSFDTSTWEVSISQVTPATIINGHPYAGAPYGAGDFINITDTNKFYNGVFKVVSSTIFTVDYVASPAAAWDTDLDGNGSVAAQYVWNWNTQWKHLKAKFMRLYNTPNVGCILVAGGLTATQLDGTVLEFPVTVQWSQAFGLNQAPLSWVPTIQNVAEQLEVPLRGQALDAFPCNGQMFICSFWDTIVLSPLNYATTSAPILGVKLVNQGRGILSSNCWVSSDRFVYGIDARDVWVFDGQEFRGLGTQRVKNWLFNQMDPLYIDRVFMEINTNKSQVEIYYPTLEAIDGVPNKMISYRYDMDVWNAPRDVNSATFACESPVWYADPIAPWANCPSTAYTGVGVGAVFDILQEGSAYKVYTASNDIVNGGSGYAVNNIVRVLGTALGGATPANDCFIKVAAVNGSGAITAVFPGPNGAANGIWRYDPGSRTVVYARADTDVRIIVKDQGYFFIDDVNGVVDPIVSEFRRDNIKMLPDYSGKLLVHRILPEIVNVQTNGLPIDPVTQPTLIGTVDISIQGANSVGQTPQATTAVTLSTDTDEPWVQINQNAHRVNSITVGDSSKSTAWLCSALTWQFTQTENDV